jgi:sugar O-acyltransferase (sialic acid O-acetyltransferase NeuD family)
MNHTRNRKRRVIVWGAGGHGKVIVDALLAADCCVVVGIVDNDATKTGATILGVRVLDFSGGLSKLANTIDFDAVAIGIGDNYVRSEKFREIRALGLAPMNVIHPAAHLSRFVELGHGVTILAGATVNPGTAIEDNVCVNTSASVDHDNHLRHSCHIFPNATLAGSVHVGEHAYVGSGAVIVPNVTIGKHSYVGAGAVVLKDVPESVTVAGNPAAEIRVQSKRHNERPEQRQWTQCLSKP